MKLLVIGKYGWDGKLSKDGVPSGPIVFPVSQQRKMADISDLLMIIVPSLGFVLCALTVAFFVRGKEGRASWDGAL